MASIFVGTYGKYANGSIFGEWLNLENYETAEEFYAACRELHKDEEDPEFMFQDWEDIPEGMAGEWMNIAKILEYLQEFDEDQREIIKEYQEEVDSNAEPQKIIDAYCGEMSGEDYAEELAEECGDMRNVPEFIKYHIDWSGVWREMTYDGWAATTNYVFSPL